MRDSSSDEEYDTKDDYIDFKETKPTPEKLDYNKLQSSFNQILLKADIHIKNILEKIESLGEESNPSGSKSKTKNSTNISNSINLSVQPSILENGKLKDFQLLGLRWLYSLDYLDINGILADEMGLGKTIQAVALIGTLFQFHSRKGPHLVIAPKSVITHWESQFTKWLPMLKIVKLQPSKEFKEDSLKIIRKSKFNVVITTYDAVRLCYDDLSDISWDYIIIDEALKLKNQANLFSEMIKRFHCKHRLVLTGTPFQNNLHELWCLLNYLMPDLFKDSTLFDSLFTEDSKILNEEQNLELVNKLKHLIKPFFLKRTKEEAIKEIPPKREIHLTVGMTDLQIGLYQDMIKNRGVVYRNETKSCYNNILSQLRKICLHPYLLKDIEDRSLDPYGRHLVEACGKMLLLDKILKKLKKENHRVLIFSLFTSLLDILEDYCISQNFEYYRIDGVTSLEMRDNQIEEFNSPNSKKFIFLLSTRSGGMGINLASADVVILYDSDFNPQMDLQAIDRAHRIGQTKEVTVYRLITENSIEEKIIERQFKKRMLDTIFIQDAKFQTISNKISKESLINMISHGANMILSSSKGTYTDDDIDQIIMKGEKLFLKTSQELQSVKDIQSISDLSLNPIHCYTHYEKANEKDDLAIKVALEEELRDDMVKPRSRRSKISKEISVEEKIKGIHKQFNTDFPDFQLYEDRERLEELYLKLKFQENEKNIIFTDEEEDEFNEIIQSGFPHWKHNEFQSYVSVCEKYGRKNYEIIHQHLPEKSISEIQHYESELFSKFEMVRFGKYRIKEIIKKEKQIEEKEKINQILNTLIDMSIKNTKFQECLEYSKRLYKGKKSENIFTEEQDREIIKLVLNGNYGEWKKICSELSKTKIFRFEHAIYVKDPKSIENRVNIILRNFVTEVELDPEYFVNIAQKSNKEPSNFSTSTQISNNENEISPINIMKQNKIEDYAKPIESKKKEKKRKVIDISSSTKKPKIEKRNRSTSNKKIPELIDITSEIEVQEFN